jgi:phosphoglycerate dehydrogenase-like enzyme
MRRPVVVYSDPPWALDPAGKVDPDRAVVEREVLGPDVELRFGPAPGGRYVLEGPEWLSTVGGARVLAITRCEITDRLLVAVGPQLRLVVRLGVGVDNLNVPLLETRGITGVYVPDYCVDEVATHAVTLGLALERHVVTQHRRLVGGVFDVYAGGVPRRLQRRTAGILGFGRIGRAVALRLRPFYGRLIASDPYVAADVVEAYGATAVDHDTLLETADAIFLHCALTPETRGFMDDRAFGRMKPGAFLVNAARGALVDKRALAGALRVGRLGGAALDVFTPENPHDDPTYVEILARENVIASSHRAFLSVEAEESQRRRAAEQIARVLTGADVDSQMRATRPPTPHSWDGDRARAGAGRVGGGRG